MALFGDKISKEEREATKERNKQFYEKMKNMTKEEKKSMKFKSL